MTYLGTRPPTLDEWNKYELHHRARLAIKPGITGMWQVSGRNHVHLLLETGDIEIGKFMKYMSECYAIYYNHKYGYRGHVFESRYKSCLVKEDAYFLQTSRYIHLNPVKAQM